MRGVYQSYPLLFLSLTALWTSGAEAGEWERISNEDGIQVSVQEIEGRELPIFKGVALINARLLDVLAVLTDTPRRTEWVHKCIDSRILKQIDELNRIVYNRTEAPWPVSDRDVVVHSRSKVNFEKNEIYIGFKNTRKENFPEIDGVVRIPRIKGFYLLQGIDNERTRVTYQIDADPGGSLPTWLSKLTSQKLPRETLTGLRAQVQKTAGSEKYKPQIKAWTEAIAGDKRKKEEEKSKKPSEDLEPSASGTGPMPASDKGTPKE